MTTRSAAVKTRATQAPAEKTRVASVESNHEPEPLPLHEWSYGALAVHPKLSAPDGGDNPTNRGARPPWSVMLQSRAIQAKLLTGQMDDPLEREADRMAEALDRPAPAPAPVLRKPLEVVQTNGGDGVFVAVGPASRRQGVPDSARNGGKPLEPGVRAEMEAHLGADLANVRIHTGPDSTRLNDELNALAFTQRNDIHFAAGKYDPSSSEGRRLLAHELTHVVQQSGSGNSGPAPIQRQPKSDDDILEYPFKVPEDVKDLGELFRRFNIYLFGSDTKDTWEGQNTDLTTLRGTTVTLRVPRWKVESQVSPEVTQAREESKKTYLGAKEDEKGRLNAETNKRYYEKTGDKPGTQIKKGEEGKSQMWEQALTDVLADKKTLAALPPEIKTLLGPETSYRPKDYQHLLKIAEKLKQFTPEDLQAYKLLAIRATSDLDLFERSVDAFLARRKELKEALDKQLQQQQAPQPQQAPAPTAAKEPTVKDAFNEKWKDLDEASIGKMSEADRYALAEQKTSELTAAQLKFMKDHPGQTAKDFAKSALLLNTGETFSAIGQDLKEASSGDANKFARWAAGMGAGAKISGWLLALAGVLYVASWFTGIGELATIAAAAGILLGTTITLSSMESDLRVKAASQATTADEFKRNVELAATARAGVFVALALIVVAALLHFTAKAFFPETIKKLNTSLKNFRERVRMKGSIYKIKPKIAADMASLKGELTKNLETAKQQAVASGDEIAGLSTEAFADKLDSGSGSFLDQSKLPPEQKVNYRELLKTPEGRQAVENYRAKLAKVLKTDVPAEIDRLGKEYGSKIDDFLKDVDEAKNHDDMNAAADKIEGTLTEEHAKKFVQGEQERITQQKLEEAAQEAHAEALKLTKDAIVNRVKTRIAAQPKFTFKFSDVELDAIIKKGKELGLDDKTIEDLLYIASRDDKPITAVDLQDQMTNWANEVSKTGVPYRFADQAQFQQFSNDLINGIKGMKDSPVPTDDVRIQGSSLRKKGNAAGQGGANDVDIAVFVEPSVFDQLLIDRFSDRIAKGPTKISLKGKSHAELAQIAEEIAAHEDQYNNQASTFKNAMRNGIISSKSDILKPLKAVREGLAGKYPNLNLEAISVLIKGGVFDLKPDLPVQSGPPAQAAPAPAAPAPGK